MHQYRKTNFKAMILRIEGRANMASYGIDKGKKKKNINEILFQTSFVFYLGLIIMTGPFGWTSPGSMYPQVKRI